MQRREFCQLLALLVASNVPSKLTGTTAISGQDKSGTGLVYNDIFLNHWIAQDHPESPARLQAIMKLLRADGIYETLIPVKPHINNLEQYLLTVHTKAHIEQITRKYQDTQKVLLAVLAGILGAVDGVCKSDLKNAFCATRPPGHHALNTGREEGFCYYNFIAIAARYAQLEYKLKKILIVDWDYHHGNGTEAAFYSDPDILFFSTHDLYAYPGTGHPGKTGEGEGQGFNINVHIDCGTTDQEIIHVFNKMLVPAAEKFKPDMIFISAGFDSRKDDLLGCFDVTDDGFTELTKIVMMLADQYCHGKLVSILEGGYNLEGNASAVLHHLRKLTGK